MKLKSTGEIDLSYKEVPERDGMVGLFTGQLSTPIVLDHVDRTSNADPLVRVNSVDVADVGNAIRFTLTMGSNIVTTVPTGTMNYRIALIIPGRRSCTFEVVASTTGRSTNATTCHNANPGEFGYKASGSSLEIYVSKIVLGSSTTFTWAFDCVLFGATTLFDNSLGSYRPATLASPSTVDLASFSGVLAATREVFHYPVVSRNPADALRIIYQSSEPVDDLALVFTDFRYDEYFGGEGPSYSPPGNDSIQGIHTSHGTDATLSFGSRNLLVSPSPAYIGHPPFAEKVAYSGRQFTKTQMERSPRQASISATSPAIPHSTSTRWV